jgi:sorbitol-6-phosphate 2-dehydrogenase
MEKEGFSMSVDMSKFCQIAKDNINKRPAGTGRLAGKIAIVTGAAQGFGKGIAEELHKEGATIVIADMNEPLAQQVAKEMGERAVAIGVNVSDEQSVADMVGKTVELFGGLDLMLSNAGVVRSGPIAQVEKKDFEFVTNVNYTGYFLCAKYAAIIMEAEHEAAPDKMFDIVTLNSKSGLEGSNKNFAYAGSKFGGIGLTQSFALELCAYNIKVNAVCPGNYLDGPLWSDPTRGLFVQYLQAGKVPGAKTVADVRRYYEAKVPMNRGCLPVDVARAVMYCVEQKYETGQAIPVTGGQVMLN